MTLHKTYLGLNEDGSPRFNYYEDDPTKVLVVTGPIYGSVVLPDGTEVDVSPDVISVDPGVDIHVSNAIGERHQAEGHPLFKADPLVDDLGFVHTPTEVGE